MPKNTVDRFWDKVKKSSGCWIWCGSKRSKGYGAFVYARGGEVVQGRAHRYSYELHKGKIPAGLCVLHRCDNPACVNPDHLFLGSIADNNADMVSKGRHVRGATYTDPLLCNYERGEGHHAAKLTESDIRMIRNQKKSGLSYSKLSRMHGLAVGHLFRIVTRKAWRHVK